MVSVQAYVVTICNFELQTACHIITAYTISWLYLCKQCWTLEFNYPPWLFELKNWFRHVLILTTTLSHVFTFFD